MRCSTLRNVCLVWLICRERSNLHTCTLKNLQREWLTWNEVTLKKLTWFATSFQHLLFLNVTLGAFKKWDPVLLVCKNPLQVVKFKNEYRSIPALMSLIGEKKGLKSQIKGDTCVALTLFVHTRAVLPPQSLPPLPRRRTSGERHHFLELTSLLTSEAPLQR